MVLLVDALWDVAHLEKALLYTQFVVELRTAVFPQLILARAVVVLASVLVAVAVVVTAAAVTGLMLPSA